MGTRGCFRVWGLWKLVVYRGFLCFFHCPFFSALALFSAWALPSAFFSPAAQVSVS